MSCSITDIQTLSITLKDRIEFATSTNVNTNSYKSQIENYPQKTWQHTFLNIIKINIISAIESISMKNRE